MNGINLLHNDLSTIIDTCSIYTDLLNIHDQDCFKLYNVLMYTAPFMHMDAVNGNSLYQLVFFDCPYELIATNLQNYLSTFRFEELPFLLRMQLRIEGAVPEIQACRDLYALLIWAFSHGKTLGVLSAITIPTLGLLGYTHLLRGTNDSGFVIQPIEHINLGQTTESDATEILIQTLLDIL